ncbi:MAG TPA: hypothetical protein VGH20_06405 [Myxococcales bacterium]|jgi:hypothetical protein
MDQPIQNLKSGWKTTEFWMCAALVAWGAIQTRDASQAWWMQTLHVAMAVVPTCFCSAHRRSLKLAALDPELAANDA